MYFCLEKLRIPQMLRLYHILIGILCVCFAYCNHYLTYFSFYQAKKKADAGDQKTLSKKSITWIVVGLVCGTLVLILTIVIIVHNVRHRYSGVFLSSHVKEQYHKQLTPDGAGTLLYQPKNFAKIVIEPHLV